jgi:hypothetical protein
MANTISVSHSSSPARSLHSVRLLRLVLGLTILFGTMVAFLGLGWDIQWHGLIGRDRTLIPPHLVILSGVMLSGIAALLAVLIETVWVRRNPDIAALLSEAYRLLVPGGRLCLVSLTHGTRGLSRLVTALWIRIHRLAPTLVGGCRPLELQVLLEGSRFHLEYVHVVTAFGIPSEIVIAKRQPEERASTEEGATR